MLLPTPRQSSTKQINHQSLKGLVALFTNPLTRYCPHALLTYHYRFPSIKTIFKVVQLSFNKRDRAGPVVLSKIEILRSYYPFKLSSAFLIFLWRFIPGEEFCPTRPCYDVIILDEEVENSYSKLFREQIFQGAKPVLFFSLVETLYVSHP